MCGPNSPILKRYQVYDKPLFSMKKYMTDAVYSKYGVGVQNDSSWKKLLPQFDYLRIAYKCCRRVVLTISAVKPFLAEKLCQVNFQKIPWLVVVKIKNLYIYIYIYIDPLTTSSRVMFTDPTLTAGCILISFFLPTAIAWNFSGFACIQVYKAVKH